MDSMIAAIPKAMPSVLNLDPDRHPAEPIATPPIPHVQASNT
jgi:hypothetical protein